ncbi:phosphatase PAP2 family protein [Carboxylicivirga linearis]|uniref:Phosphatase PAP2 family protein n=1 Tax=Carboxylicivirga linearis TaxID=1628157 RepID=A0ABS5JYC4_9BACT|nr:phosphatase PAP2 family protein [Carboxylicivirga linearis]MBS2099885.1 phosphatase PAP2 family protein [Carboxylicivirga linearis]
MQSRIKILLISTIICLLTLSTTFILPYGFSAIHDGWAAELWLFISNTGGTFGVPLITISFCLLISLQYKGLAKKMLFLFISLISFSAILGGFAQLNEHFIKEKLRIERPNIIYLHNQKGFDSETFYNLPSKAERRQYLEVYLNEKGSEFITFNDKTLHPEVLNHWLHETGFSFPSGHSVNAFLMATLMAYILLFTYHDFRRRSFFILPLLWATLVAFSRVILGVHSPTDITIGALMGSLLAYTIVSSGLIDKFFKQKQIK